MASPKSWGVLFDMDGTITHSDSTHFEVRLPSEGHLSNELYVTLKRRLYNTSPRLLMLIIALLFPWAVRYRSSKLSSSPTSDMTSTRRSSRLTFTDGPIGRL